MTVSADRSRNRQPLALAIVARAIVALALVAAGGGCRREPPVASALAAEGTVERDHEGAVQAVVAGTAFTVGDTLRTGRSSKARLALTGGGVIRVGEGARLRFQRGGLNDRQSPAISVELGSAEIAETTADVAVVSALGRSRIPRGARVRVHSDGDTASLEVVVGRAVMIEGAQEVAIEAGQGVRIKIGSPAIERFALKVGAAVVERERPPGEGTGGEARGGGPGGGADPDRTAAAERAGDGAARAPARVDDRGRSGSARELASGAGQESHEAGARADITLAAGESATLHDGHPPASVRLRLEGVCPGQAIVEVAAGRSHSPERVTGSGSVVFRLTPGTRSYRVRCADDARGTKPRASGTLTLRRDTGYVPLPRRAPVNVIDADGRRYTVLFQTRVPQLTLAWPGAPAGRDSWELHVESADGDRVVAASPGRPLPAGTVQEGTYTLWYRTPDGTKSPKTTLNVRFDNAAPTAQFFRAPPAAEGARGAIPIDGVTIEGAKVSVGGEPLRIDARGRFRAETTPLEGDDAVAVRLEHPRIGIHYYLRRRAETR